MSQSRFFSANTVSLKESVINAKSLQEVLADFKENYPHEEWWRLAVDGRQYGILFQGREQFGHGMGFNHVPQSSGWTAYESTEPNSIKAFLYAWNFCCQKLSAPAPRESLTLNFILELRKKVTIGIEDIHLKNYKLRNESTCFNFTKENWELRYNIAGIVDLLTEMRDTVKFSAKLCIKAEKGKKLESSFFRSSDGEYILNQRQLSECTNGDLTNIAHKIKDCILSGSEVKYGAPLAVDIGGLMKEAIVHYNQSIGNCKNAEEKLLLIGKTIQAFERIHPFMDGNGRTFVNLLLNYLLMEEGFPPATFFDPNMFDIYNDIVSVIQQGILNTLSIYAGTTNLFNYTASAQMKEQMQDMLRQSSMLVVKEKIDQILEDVLLNHYNHASNYVEVLDFIGLPEFRFLYQYAKNAESMKEIFKIFETVLKVLDINKLHKTRQCLAIRLKQRIENLDKPDIVIANAYIPKVMLQLALDYNFMRSLQNDRIAKRNFHKLLQEYVSQLNSSDLKEYFVKAVLENKVKLTEIILLSKKIDLNCPYEELGLLSPLIFAVKHRHKNMITALLKNKTVDINFHTLQGTALMVAREIGDNNIITKLLDVSNSQNVLVSGFNDVSNPPPVASISIFKTVLDDANSNPYLELGQNQPINF